MGFLNKNKESSIIEFTVPVGTVDAKIIQNHIQIILEYTNISDLKILSAICQKPLVKKLALEKAKEYV